MFHEAEEYGLREPELIDLESDFRVNLYRMKTEVDDFGVVEPKKDKDVGTNGTDEDMILNLVCLDSKIRQKEIHEKTGIPIRTIKRIMAALQQEGRIERNGSNRSGEWIVKF